jgi:LuxR family maltose regulon positive regulatory protein
VIITRVYQALTAPDTDSAVMSLGEALTMAEPEGYVRTFVDEGRLLAPLLRTACSQGINPEYTIKLLTIIEAEEQQRRKARKTEGALSPYRSLLSKREVEVLRLLAVDLTNRQIADRLFISTGTVKIHVHNILEKLGAKVRFQAVARAREMNLI